MIKNILASLGAGFISLIILCKVIPLILFTANIYLIYSIQGENINGT
jgi:hypothetical protein